MSTTADLKKGLCIIFNNEPHLVLEKTFVSPGKGSAFFRTKLKNLKTGVIFEFTFKSGEKIEPVSLQTREYQFLYKQGNEFIFMNPKNFEQISLKEELLGNYRNFLKEGDVCQILTLEGEAVGIKPPLKVKLRVIESENAVKGNTVTSATKPVKVETGYIVQVPLFIKEGDFIIINTETGEYVERA